jgi:integrase
MAALTIKNGIWYFRKMINGIQINKSLKTGNKKDAERLAAQMETDAYSQQYGWAKNVTFLEWWRIFEKTYLPRYSATTQDNIKRVVGKVMPEWRHRRIMQIRPEECERFLTLRLTQGAAKGTVGLEKRLLRIVFNAAQEDGRITRNPWNFKLTGLTALPRERVLSLDEEDKLLIHCSIKMQRIVRFLLLTGLRAEELRTLKAKDRVQLPAPGLRILGKGGKIRVVPLIEESAKLFPLVLDAMQSNRGGVLVADPLRKKLQRAAEKAGIDIITLHDLRRTFATRCIEGGMRLEDLSEILGHAGVAVTAHHYVHRTTVSRSEALTKALRGSEPLVNGKNRSEKS